MAAGTIVVQRLDRTDEDLKLETATVVRTMTVAEATTNTETTEATETIQAAMATTTMEEAATALHHLRNPPHRPRLLRPTTALLLLKIGDNLLLPTVHNCLNAYTL